MEGGVGPSYYPSQFPENSVGASKPSVLWEVNGFQMTDPLVPPKMWVDAQL